MGLKFTRIVFSLIFLFPLWAIGQNWTSVSSQKSGGGVISRPNSSIVDSSGLYVGLVAGEVWVSKSTNGGDWTKVGSGMEGKSIKQLEKKGELMLALTDDSLYRYDKATDKWLYANLSNLGSVAILEQNGYLFASKEFTGIYRSIDSAKTWQLYDKTSTVENLVGQSGPKGIYPDKRIWELWTYDTLVIAQSKHAVHISEDNGETWYYRWGDLIVDKGGGSNIQEVFYGYLKGKPLLITTSDGAKWNGFGPNMSVSENLGVNYTLDDGTNGSISGVVYSIGRYGQDFDVYDDKLLVMRTKYRVYVSLNGGGNWTLSSSYLGSGQSSRLLLHKDKLIFVDLYRGIRTLDLTHKPSWKSGFPTLDDKGTTFTMKGEGIDVDGSTVHYIVLPDTAKAPSGEDIINAVDAYGKSGYVSGSKKLENSLTFALDAVGLQAKKKFNVYAVFINPLGNLSDVRSLPYETNKARLSISSSNGGTTSTKSGYYADSVLFSATPDPGYILRYWYINQKNVYRNNFKLLIDSDISAQPVFGRASRVSIKSVGNGKTFPAGDSVYAFYDEIQLISQAQEGHELSYWEVNGKKVEDRYHLFTISDSVYDVKGVFTAVKTIKLPECPSHLGFENPVNRTTDVWEKGFQERLKKLYGDRVSGYDDNVGYAGTDAGKDYWPIMLSKLAWDTLNTEKYIKKITTAMAYRQAGAGSFWYPFSAAGYSMYYFQYKDSIKKYAPEQLDTIANTFYGQDEWKYLMRKDGYLDMLYPSGKEFNSENFHWMLRTTGFLFAHEFHGKQGRDNTNLSFIDADGNNRDNVDVLLYFDGFLDNLTRALYNSGRVEWNSNNYWDHTFYALMSLYEGADKCNHPIRKQVKAKARACLDWMMLEVAIHHLDGFTIAADARAKSDYANNKVKSIMAYLYAYFAEEGHYPTYGKDYFQTVSPGKSASGFLLNSSYRPPKIIRDIAQKKVDLPMEIRSAKPFYHIDFGDFWNKGQAPYHYWKGDNELSRKFEFETIYMGENFLMSSIAGGRPDGSIGTFSEQAQWEIGVKGKNLGALQITGNASNMGSAPAGRYPYHQIGQYRNVMLHLVKRPFQSTSFYVLIPDKANSISNSGTGAMYAWKDKSLYVNMGQGVYIAFSPLSTATSTSVNKNPSQGSDHTSVSWNFASEKLGGVVIEVGTETEYSSFDDFIDKMEKNASIKNVGDESIVYESASKHTIEMKHTGTGSFKMLPFTQDTPFRNPYTPAGKYPGLKADGDSITFDTWHSYETVLGQDKIEQQWGSGILDLTVGDEIMRVQVNEKTADVTHFTNTETALVTSFSYDKASEMLYSTSVLPKDSQQIDFIWNLDGQEIKGSRGLDTIRLKPENQQEVMLVAKFGRLCEGSMVKTFNGDDLLHNETFGNKDLSDKLKVYPNPTTGLLSVSSIDENELFVEVYDMLGSLMLGQTSKQLNGVPLIDISTLAKGMYVLKIFDSRNRIIAVKRVILE